MRVKHGLNIERRDSNLTFISMCSNNLTFACGSLRVWLGVREFDEYLTFEENIAILM